MKDDKDDNLTVVEDDENFDQLINSSNLVLVDFNASWCGPCQIMQPIIEEMARESNGDFVVAQVNIDETKKTVEKYEILSVPTFIIFLKGKEVDRISGALSKEDLLSKIKNYIKPE